MTADWNKFGRPRVAMFTRVSAAFVTCLAVLLWPWCLFLAMRDWTLIFVPLILTTAVVIQRLAMRKIYRAEPDYAAIAHIEREIYGKAFEHAGAPQSPRIIANWPG